MAEKPLFPVKNTPAWGVCGQLANAKVTMPAVVFRDFIFKVTDIHDNLVKSHLPRRDGLWKKLDIRGVVSCTTIRHYIWYGELSCKTCNDVDRAFYESIIYGFHVRHGDRRMRVELSSWLRIG